MIISGICIHMHSTDVIKGVLSVFYTEKENK